MMPLSHHADRNGIAPTGSAITAQDNLIDFDG